MSYVYKATDYNDGNYLYTVGFYDPEGKWHPESDWPTQREAGQRVHYLNGGEVQGKVYIPVR